MTWTSIQPILIPVIVVGGLGMAFGVLLAWFAKKFAIKFDPAIEKIESVLPGVNCGACGFPGCSALAEAIVRGDAPIDSCPVGGTRTWQEIGRVLGKEVSVRETRKAVLICQGGNEVATTQAIYRGVADCRAATVYGVSFKACHYGCLGLGSCQRICPFEAIRMDETTGLPVIIGSRCTGCGRCVKECPRSVLTLLPARDLVVVACTSPDTARSVKAVCRKGCIKCQLCVKVCPVKAISFPDGKIRIDRKICTLCGLCVDKCPTGCIVRNIRNSVPAEASSSVPVPAVPVEVEEPMR